MSHLRPLTVNEVIEPQDNILMLPESGHNALRECKRCHDPLDRHRIKQTTVYPNPHRATVIHCDQCDTDCHQLGGERGEEPLAPIQSHWVRERLRRAGFGR